MVSRPLTVLGPTQRANANHGTAVASILCGEGRGDPRARGLLPLGGLVFCADHGSPELEDHYATVERFVRDHRAALLSSSSSNWGNGHQDPTTVVRSAISCSSLSKTSVCFYHIWQLVSARVARSCKRICGSRIGVHMGFMRA